MNETKNPLIIFGSSRSNGQTKKAVDLLLDDNIAKIIDLNKINFSGFDYEYKNTGDDFMKIVDMMLNSDPIILATPIYWYTMSDIMKRFIDRWSDLLDIAKDKGRKMRSKTMYIVTSYAVHPEGKNGFETIMINICNYMGMDYGGCFYYYSGRDESVKLKNSIEAQKMREKIFTKNL